MPRRNWTRAETLVAFALYCKLPFGRLHARNPEIVATARALDRTASSVAMKCCNLASLDETHQARGVSGLAKVSAMDRNIWNEFQSNPDEIAYASASALAGIEAPNIRTDPTSAMPNVQGKERERTVRTRVNQYFFRDLILAGYNEQCSVCALPLRALLVAAHIVPWSVDSSLRMNPRNGLCLCGTHDLAFERGLLRVHRDLSIEISIPNRYRSIPVVSECLLKFNGNTLQLPQRWHPTPEFLARKLGLVQQRTTGVAALHFGPPIEIDLTDQPED